MNNTWKFIDTNENYFPNYTNMQYAFPFLIDISWIILDTKNYNKIKAKHLSSNDLLLILQCDDRNAISHEQSDYYSKQQVST
jgi:hypothetical protein